jgi:hypothetical protein
VNSGFCGLPTRAGTRFDMKEESVVLLITFIWIAFLKLVTNQIKSTNPSNTLSQAITFYGLCDSVREQDFDLLKQISDFLLEYKILSEHKWNQLREEITLHIPAKKGKRDS